MTERCFFTIAENTHSKFLGCHYDKGFFENLLCEDTLASSDIRTRPTFFMYDTNDLFIDRDMEFNKDDPDVLRFTHLFIRKENDRHRMTLMISEVEE